MTIVVSNLSFDSSGNNRIYANTSSPTNQTLNIVANTQTYIINSTSVSSANMVVNSTAAYFNGSAVNETKINEYVIFPSGATFTNANLIPTGILQNKNANSTWLGYYNTYAYSYADLLLYTPVVLLANTTTAPQSCAIFDYVFGNNVYVGIGYDGLSGGLNANAVYYSADSVTWTYTTSSPNMTSASNYYNPGALAYGNGVFIIAQAVSNSLNGSSTLQTSSNGSSWTLRTLANTSTEPYSVAYGNGVFVAVGGNTGALGISAVYSFPLTSIGSIQTSTNGITWTNRTNPFTSNCVFTNVGYANGYFVAVGYGPPSGGGSGGLRICRSTNGTTWTVSNLDGTSTTSSTNTILPSMVNLQTGSQNFLYLSSINTIHITGSTNITSADNSANFYSNGVLSPSIGGCIASVNGSIIYQGSLGSYIIPTNTSTIGYLLDGNAGLTSGPYIYSTANAYLNGTFRSLGTTFGSNLFSYDPQTYFKLRTKVTAGDQISYLRAT